MRLRLLRPWKNNKIGRIYANMPDGIANLLIQRGFGIEDILQKDIPQKPKSKRNKREKVHSQ